MSTTMAAESDEKRDEEPGTSEDIMVVATDDDGVDVDNDPEIEAATAAADAAAGTTCTSGASPATNEEGVAAPPAPSAPVPPAETAAAASCDAETATAAEPTAVETTAAAADATTAQAEAAKTAAAAAEAEAAEAAKTAAAAAALLTTATQTMRLTSPNNYALATSLHTILADSLDTNTGQESSGGGDADASTDKTSSSSMSQSMELLAPGAALLTCLVLAIGRDELDGKGTAVRSSNKWEKDEAARKQRAREAAGYTLIAPRPHPDADDGSVSTTSAQAVAAPSTTVPPAIATDDVSSKPLTISPPVGSLHTFSTMSQHLSDLAAYCRTRADAVTVCDVVTYLLDFFTKEEQKEQNEQDEQEEGEEEKEEKEEVEGGSERNKAMSRIRAAMLDHPSLATLARRDRLDGSSSNGSGTTATGSAASSNDNSKACTTLQPSLRAILRHASATITMDAECSADFAYLWDSCSRTLRRNFAKAFMGSAGYETRYEALAEAARCAYVLSRYYGSTTGFVMEQSCHGGGGGSGTTSTSGTEKTMEEERARGWCRAEGIATVAACIALVYGTAVLEPDIRRLDADNARRAAQSGEKDGGTAGGGTPVKNKETQKAIPSPARSSQRRSKNKKNKKRKAAGGSAAANADEEEDGSKKDTDKASDEDKDSSSPSLDEKSAAAAAAATAAATIAPYPPMEAASYYYGPLRIPRTSRSNETEALDSLIALAEKDAGNSDNENGSRETLPDIVGTLVKASNELMTLLQSSSAIRTNNGSANLATSSRASAFLITETKIEHEMEQVYKSLAVDKKHFNAFHSTMPGSEDEATVGTPAFARKTVPMALAPFLGSHWARFDSGRIMASLYFYRLLQYKEWKTHTSSSLIPNKIEAFIANPNLIEYSNNQGSFVQSSYIRYQALGAIAPVIKSDLDAFGVSACVETPVAKIGILDLSVSEPFHDGPNMFDNDEAMVDPMEENEWINALLLDVSRARAIKPSSRLRLYLRSGGRLEQGGEDQWKDVIVLILNSVLGRISNHYFNLSLTPTVAGGSTATSPKLKLDANGELVLADLKLDITGPMTDNTFGAALLALYYFSLEAILFDETARTKTSQHHKLILSPGFHRSLLAISCMCLLRVVGAQPSGSETTDREVSIVANGKVDLMSVLELTKCSPFEYLKVSEIFLRSSRQGVFGGLPVIVRRHVTEIDEMIIESSLWATKVPNSNWKVLLQETDKLEAAGHWPTESLDTVEDPSFEMKSAPAPPASSPLFSQYKYIGYIFRRVSLIASKRISALCNELSFPTIVASEIWLAFRYILRSARKLLKDRHMDQVLLATAYAVCRLGGLDPHNNLFSRLCAAYEHINEDKGKRACQKVIQSVINDKMASGRGNIIDFYNKIYMYQMKTYLIRCASLKLLAQKVRAFSDAGGTAKVAEKEVRGRERVRQVDGTNVYLKLPDSKRPRNSSSSLNAKRVRTKCIHSFGDASQKNVNLAQKLVVQGSKSIGN